MGNKSDHMYLFSEILMLIDIEGYCCFIARALVVVCTKYVYVHNVQIVRFCIRFCTSKKMYMYKSVLE